MAPPDSQKVVQGSGIEIFRGLTLPRIINEGYSAHQHFLRTQRRGRFLMEKRVRFLSLRLSSRLDSGV